jgi:hypothetical protein
MIPYKGGFVVAVSLLFIAAAADETDNGTGCVFPKNNYL